MILILFAAVLNAFLAFLPGNWFYLGNAIISICLFTVLMVEFDELRKEWRHRREHG